MISESQVLSPKAKENLRKNAELRQKDSKFIKLEPNERKVLQFDPEKIEQKEEEFSGKKIQRYYYTVTEPESANSQQEKYLTVSKRTSEEIDSYLLQALTLLKIQRFVLGKDTRYHVIPAS
jgi:hypothetical protein